MLMNERTAKELNLTRKPSIEIVREYGGCVVRPLKETDPAEVRIENCSETLLFLVVADAV